MSGLYCGECHRELVLVEYEAFCPRCDRELLEAAREHLRCVRCGELIEINKYGSLLDAAEVADGLVHAGCMRPGEEIA